MPIGRKSATAPVTFMVVGSAAAPAYHAFLDVGDGTMQASIYDSAGAWVSDRGGLIATTGAPDSGTGGYCYIGTDSFAAVADGSLAWLNSDGTISVVDPVAETCDNFAAADTGYLFTGLVFAGGWAYWIEFGPTSLSYGVPHQAIEVRCRKIRLDGTGIATLEAVSFFGDDVGTPSLGPPTFGIWLGAIGVRATPTAVIGKANWADTNPDGSFGADVKFPFATGATIAASTSGGGFFGVSYSSGSLGVESGPPATADSSNGSAWTDAWTGIAWGPSNVSVNSTDAMAYLPGTGIVQSSLAGLGGSPTTTIPAVEDHPTLLAAQTVMFLIP